MNTIRILSELRSERDRLNEATAALDGIISGGAERQPRAVLREIAAPGSLLLVESAFRCS